MRQQGKLRLGVSSVPPSWWTSPHLLTIHCLTVFWAPGNRREAQASPSSCMVKITVNHPHSVWRRLLSIHPVQGTAAWSQCSSVKRVQHRAQKSLTCPTWSPWGRFIFKRKINSLPACNPILFPSRESENSQLPTDSSQDRPIIELLIQILEHQTEVSLILISQTYFSFAGRAPRKSIPQPPQTASFLTVRTVPLISNMHPSCCRHQFLFPWLSLWAEADHNSDIPE